MKRRDFLCLGAASTVLAACGSIPGMPAGEDPLLGALSSQLGVSDSQASGGVGSMMSLAKTKLSPENYSALTKAIPGIDGYMKTAQEVLGPGAKITDMTGLKSAFRRLGMNADMVGKFKPIVLETAGKLGGDSVKQLLAGALG
jgi:Protein of unknown function VcgC/VcgE (DUF2780)